MLKSQTIQLKMSKIRQVLNGMLEIRVDDHDRTAERKRLDDELVGLETEYRAAIEAEGSATGAAFGDDYTPKSLPSCGRWSAMPASPVSWAMLPRAAESSTG